MTGLFYVYIHVMLVADSKNMLIAVYCPKRITSCSHVYHGGLFFPGCIPALWTDWTEQCSVGCGGGVTGRIRSWAYGDDESCKNYSKVDVRSCREQPCIPPPTNTGMRFKSSYICIHTLLQLLFCMIRLGLFYVLWGGGSYSINPMRDTDYLGCYYPTPRFDGQAMLDLLGHPQDDPMVNAALIAAVMAMFLFSFESPVGLYIWMDPMTVVTPSSCVQHCAQRGFDTLYLQDGHIC